jgi:hypothetical protein
MDGQLARSEAELKGLLGSFVCVRMVQANGLDLSLFRFDPNLTWAVHFVNADRAVYGRYGTRADKGAVTRISTAGLRRAMEGALELHAGYPGNRAALAAKTAPAPAVGRFLKDYPPTLQPATASKSCMHCHEIQDAEQRAAREGGKPLPDELLWSWPLPDWLGLSLDPSERATVKTVSAGSAAAAAGFREGDRIVALEGQPVISIADVQWALQHAKEPGVVTAEVERDGARRSIGLPLAKGWRRAGDFSWRFFVHEAFYTGNLRVKALPVAEKGPLGIGEQGMALQVTRVGWPVGPPAEAKKAGFQVGDVLIEVDGRSAAWTESDFVAYAAQEKKMGEVLGITVLRGGRRMSLKLPVTR